MYITSSLLDFAELLGIGHRPNTFSYAELRSATEDFVPSNKLGEGGFGPVYKVNFILLHNHIIHDDLTFQKEK